MKVKPIGINWNLRYRLEKGRNENFKIQAFPGLNHLFQNCETGLPNEYGEIEETFSKEVLDVMTTWLTNTIEKIEE